MSYNLEQSIGGNFCLTSAGLATSTANLSTANTLTYAIGGVLLSKAASTVTVPAANTNTSVPSTIGAGATGPVVSGDGITRWIYPGTKAAFGVWIDYQGAFHITQGFPVNNTDGSVSQTVADAAAFGPFGPWALLGIQTVSVAANLLTSSGSAQTAIVTPTLTTAAGSNVVTPSAMTSLALGQQVVAVGIPANTYITAVGSSTVTLSNAATVTASGTASSVYLGAFVPGTTSFGAGNVTTASYNTMSLPGDHTIVQ